MDRTLGTGLLPLGSGPHIPLGSVAAVGTHWHLVPSSPLLTIVVHHSCLLLAAVHGEPDDLYLHEGVDDLGIGRGVAPGSRALPPPTVPMLACSYLPTVTQH